MRLTLAHEGTVYTYDVRKEITTLGRDPQCDISLPTSTISRFHAQLRREGDDLVVKDLGSRNGVFVNGARVGEARLRSGDELRLGKIVVRYEAGAVPQVPTGFSPSAPAEAPQVPLQVGDAPAGADNNPTPVDLAFSPQEIGRSPAPPPAGGVRPAAQSPGGGGGSGNGLLLWLGRRWKLAAAGFVVFDLLAIGAFVALRNGAKGEAPAEPPRSRTDGAALEEIALRMERARDAVRKDPDGARKLWAGARADLAALRGKGHDGTVSRLVAIVDWWEPVRPDYGNFDWDSYRRIVDILTDLEAERKAPPRVAEIARAWADWLTREAVAREKLLKIEPLMAPAAGLARWQEAHAALLAADRKCIAWPSYEPKLDELAGRIREAHLAQARRAFDQGDWDAASAALDAAGRWGGEGLTEALRAAIGREKAASGSLAAARAALAEGQDEAAGRHAAAVPDDSRFAAEAREMREDLARRKARQEVLALFNRGEGLSAIERLIEGPYVDDALAQTIRRVDGAMKAALVAEGKLDFDGTILKAGEILNLLADPSWEANDYRVKAQAMRDVWDLPARRAQRLYDEGRTRQAAGDVQGAYAWWSRARKEDPEGKWGEEEAKSYQTRARTLRNEAMRLAQAGDRAGARKLAGEALAIAEPGSYEERKSREVLAGLQD